jgi:hypothetical protein
MTILTTMLQPSMPYLLKLNIVEFPFLACALGAHLSALQNKLQPPPRGREKAFLLFGTQTA